MSFENYLQKLSSVRRLIVNNWVETEYHQCSCSDSASHSNYTHCEKHSFFCFWGVKQNKLNLFLSLSEASWSSWHSKTARQGVCQSVRFTISWRNTSLTLRWVPRGWGEVSLSLPGSGGNKEGDLIYEKGSFLRYINIKSITHYMPSWSQTTQHLRPRQKHERDMWQYLT